VNDDERKQRVLDLLGKLQPREQQVILLRLQEGLSYQEISTVTGRTEGNVGNILHHAVRKLSQALRRSGALQGV
jgi:RNA polymerase sigma-70 factor (ECF subfamily)